MPRAAWQTDWLPSILGAVYQSAVGVTTFFLPVFLKNDLGYDGAQIGMLYAVFAISGMLAALPAGLGNDRVSSRSLILLALLAQGACFVLMANSLGYLIVAMAFGGWALGQNLFRVSLDVQVMRGAGGVELSRRVYLYQFLRFFGLFAGIVPAGYLLAGYDFRIALVATAALLVLLGAATRGLAPTPLAPVRLSDYYGDLSRPEVRFFAVWLFLFSLHWGAESTCYGLYLRENLGLSFSGMGWYFAGEYLAMAAFFGLMCLKQPQFASAEKLQALAIFGLATSGLGQLFMVNDVYALSLSARIVHAVGDAAMQVVFYFGIARLFSGSRLGGNTGFINSVTMLGTVSGSLLFGYMGQEYGYGLPLQASGLLVFLLVGLLLVAGRRYSSGASVQEA